MEMIFHKKALDCWSNSSCRYHRKCIENSVDNMRTDLTVSRVKPGLWPGVCITRGVVSQSLSFFSISRKIQNDVFPL